MKDEADMRKYIRTGLDMYGIPTTIHTDVYTLGVPDLSYSADAVSPVNGWIELKYLPEWPKNKETIIRIPHYTSEQRKFLRERGKIAGNCWLLVGVDRAMMLFDHKNAQIVGGLSQYEMEDAATFRWSLPGQVFGTLSLVLSQQAVSKR